MTTLGIGFDIDHTLLIDNRLEQIAFLRLLENIRSDGGQVNATLLDEMRAIDTLLDRQRHSGFPIEETVVNFANEHGISDRERAHAYIARFKSIALALVDEVVIPMPGAREMLEGLRARGVAIACLTNGWNPLQQAKALRAGFDGPVIVSAEIGVQKPDPHAFSALAEVLEAEQLWYVGDNPKTDIGGAQAAGFQGVWFDAEGKTYPPELPTPVRTIHRLTELLEGLEIPITHPDM